ncbi:MAG: acyl-CoA thioesterase [Deltaproteobacteria bacterium]|nr:acyl-CoA thioesterase [Deltaproteobacteria bacterium]
MTEVVMPSDTNSLGTIFGGKVMAWIDIAAATAAIRHTRRTVVTASIDSLHFLSPIRTGYIVNLKASVNYTGTTSMEVGVRVESENPITGERYHTASAYLTFVALDDHGKPATVPPLLPETEEEKIRFRQGAKRRETRLQLAKEIKLLEEQQKLEKR